MKKSFLALICLVLLAFVGCNKEKMNPTIKFITTGTYTNSTTELHVGEKATFGVEATSPFMGGKGISKIVVEYSNGEEGHVFEYDPAEDSPSRSWVKTFNTEGKVTVTATAYDANGKSASASLQVTVGAAVNAPTIKFLTGGTYTSDGMAIYTDTQRTFGVEADANQTSQSPITKIDVQYSNENGIFNIYNNATGEATVSQDWTKTFAQDATINITATATAADGTTASASISVIVAPIPGPDANPFIGVYNCNDLNVTGHLVASLQPLGEFDDDVDFNLSNGSFVISQGTTYNDVVVRMFIESNEYNLNATTIDNIINFEETEVLMATQISGVPVTIRAMLGGSGTLNNNVIDYHGTIGESAYVTIYSSNEIPATVTNGKMNGTFTKLTAK